MKPLAILAVLALTGCAALGSVFNPTPDPKPAKNLAHVTRLVAKDPDPADAALNADATATAQGIAAEASKSGDVAGTLNALGGVAAGTGTPLGVVIGSVLGAIGLAFTTGKTIYRTFKASGGDAAAAATPAKPAA